MPATPGRALTGTAITGVGILMVYAAYRNVPVFGSTGLLTEALRTGRLQIVQAKTQPATSTTGTSHAGH